jgi:hypothetical protein
VSSAFALEDEKKFPIFLTVLLTPDVTLLKYSPKPIGLVWGLTFLKRFAKSSFIYFFLDFQIFIKSKITVRLTATKPSQSLRTSTHNGAVKPPAYKGISFWFTLQSP